MALDKEWESMIIFLMHCIGEHYNPICLVMCQPLFFQVEIEKMEVERTLAHARFQVEGTARNNLILCDLGGRPPRRVDDDDLTLGASASPTTTITIPAITSTERTGFERPFISYDTSATTSDYSSYSSPLIKHDTGQCTVIVILPSFTLFHSSDLFSLPHPIRNVKKIKC